MIYCINNTVSISSDPLAPCLHESLGYKTPAAFRAEWKEVA